MTTKTIVKRTIREIEWVLAAGFTIDDVNNWRAERAVRIDPRTGTTSDGRTLCACCAAGTADPRLPGVSGFLCNTCIDMSDRIEDHLGIKVFPPGPDFDPDQDPDDTYLLAVDPEPLRQWRANLVETVAHNTGWIGRLDIALCEWQEWCAYDGLGPARALVEMLYRLAPYLIDLDPCLGDIDWLTAPQDDHAHG